MLKLKYLNLLVVFSLVLCSEMSWAQKDTLDYTIRSWELNDDQSKSEVPIDTFLQNFQTYNPIYRSNFTQAFLGNAGQASQSTFYLDRKQHPFLFFTPYYDYLFLPENTRFYNTKQQYTEFKYVTNFTKKNNLQNVDLIHTQNILPNLNMGIQYRLLGALGEYGLQQTRDHFFRAFGSYETDDYNAYIVYHYNKINSELSGGIQSDTLLDNPNIEFNDTKLIPVNLEDSKNEILGRNINLRHHYILSKKVEEAVNDSVVNIYKIPRLKIGHELDWNYNKRIYTNQGGEGFYQQFFIDTAAVTEGALAIDSTGYTSFNNTFFLQLIDDTLNRALPSIILAYENRREFFHSYQNTIKDYEHYAKLKFVNSTYKNWYWYFSGQYEMFEGDFAVDGYLRYEIGKEKRHNLSLRSTFSHTEVNRFLEQYSSNFYKWEQSFDDKFALSTFDFSYTEKKLKLTLGVKQAYLDNYVYLASKQDSVWQNDTLTSFEYIKGYPFQESSTFGILTFYMNHQLDWGPFHMKNAIAYQKISNDSTLHLPELQWYNSTYFEMRFFKRVLTAQVGFDIRYNSAYFADGFMPATGLFYNQYEKQYGDYPYIDVFVNFKLKRARLFFKMEHINKGTNGNQYYTVDGYPMNPRVFRFGLSWRFYN